MRFNEKRFFELAKENGLESADITINEKSSFAVSVFHKEIDSLTSSSTYSLVARGIKDHKLGTAVVDSQNKVTPEYLIETIKRSASLIENNDPVSIFKGSEKYHKKSLSNSYIFEQKTEEIVRILLKIEEKLKKFDKRINEVVSVGYSRSYSHYKKSNSYGLKLSQKTSTYSYYAEVTAKDKDEVRSGYDVFVSIDPTEFDINKFVEKSRIL